jgi:hypothetical protein
MAIAEDGVPTAEGLGMLAGFDAREAMRREISFESGENLIEGSRTRNHVAI